jgi:ribosomal protein L37AE/L43A
VNTRTNTRRPKPCHRDRHLDQRIVNGEHRDDCPINDGHPEHCPGTGGRGCAPCTAPHCVICTTRHTDNDHPLTCPTCIGNVRTDLHEILWLCRHLRWQATRAGHDGRLQAAAPIPGGDALVLYARAGAFSEHLQPSKTLDDDHHAHDVIPVLLPLAAQAIAWRRYFGHDLAAKATVSGIVGYLADGERLGLMAQATDGPGWTAFAADMAALRRQLEGVLHDESEPEQGISCFECGQRLVRKFGDPRPCRHSTPARRWLTHGLPAARAAARAQLQALVTYPELGPPTYADHRAARRVPTAAEESAARVPCSACTNQGGIADPSIGQSWECIGCRKHYTPGEYANAVRADLSAKGPAGDSWTYIAMAAEAATTMCEIPIPPATVRRWVDRNQVLAVCRWAPGVTFGQILVFWPSVRERALKSVETHMRAEAERARLEQQRAQFRAAVDAGEDPDAAGRRLGIHPARVARFETEIEAEGRRAS